MEYIWHCIKCGSTFSDDDIKKQGWHVVDYDIYQCMGEVVKLYGVELPDDIYKPQESAYE